MNVKRVLPALLLLAGFAVPLQAQGTLPVQIVCVKGAGTFKPLCSDTKKAVNSNPQFRQARNGARYVVILFAQKGKIDGGRISAAIAIGAILSDPLSQQFPYSFGAFPFVFAPDESRFVGPAIVDGALPVFVDAFSDLTDEINSFGPLGREFGETTEDGILEEMRLEMLKILKEQTN